MSDQPSKEATERAGGLAHCTCGLRETVPHDKGCPIWHIARAIDEAIQEERAKGAVWSWVWKRAAKHYRQQAQSLASNLLEFAKANGQAKQLCGHPVSCIVGTGEGASHCAWCEDVARREADIEILEAKVDTLHADR